MQYYLLIKSPLCLEVMTSWQQHKIVRFSGVQCKEICGLLHDSYLHCSFHHLSTFSFLSFKFLLLSFSFLYVCACTCACVIAQRCVVCVWMHVDARDQHSVFFNHFSILIFEMSLIELRAPQSAILISQWSPVTIYFQLSISGVPNLAFTWTLGIWTQVLMPTQKVFYLLNHLLSSSYLSFSNCFSKYRVADSLAVLV